MTADAPEKFDNIRAVVLRLIKKRLLHDVNIRYIFLNICDEIRNI